MSTVYVDTEQSVGAGSVVADPDGSGYNITLPDTTVELSAAQLLGIVQAGAALLGVGAKPARIAFIGDSNMVLRPGVTVEQTLPSVLSAALGASAFGVFAFGGETSADGVARLPAVKAFKPTHIIIAHGVNDADPVKNISAQNYADNMLEMIRTGFGLQAKVIVVSPIFVAQTGYLERQRDTYMPTWQKLNGIDGVTFIDVYSRMGAMYMQDANRTRFDALYNNGDTMHYGVSGILWLRDRIKEVWN